MPLLAQNALQHRRNRQRQQHVAPPSSPLPPSSPRRFGAVSPSRSFDVDDGDDRPPIPQRTKSCDEGTGMSSLQHPLVTPTRNPPSKEHEDSDVGELPLLMPRKPSNLHRMTQTLQQSNHGVVPPLSQLSPQESLLWEAIQNTLSQHNAQPSVETPSARLQQEQHDREMSALQRVLADVTAERDALRDKPVATTSRAPPKVLDHSSDVPSLASSFSLQSEEELRKQLVFAQDERARLQGLLQSSQLQVASARQEVVAKHKALENAKMIITSLESASGSLAVDLRQKVRAKDDEIAVLQSQQESWQRCLDVLAQDLKKAQHELAQKRQENYDHFLKRLRLTSKLDCSLRETEHFASVYEATQDTTALHEVLRHVRSAMETLRQCQTDVRSDTKVQNDASILPFLVEHCPAVGDLQRELEDKKRRIHLLEEQVGRLRHSNESSSSHYATPHEELLALREQYHTNLEVLARKERELAVLRDSLRVDDEDGGYISDDASEDDDEDGASLSKSMMSGEYGPAHAEAIATLMVHGTSIEATPRWGLSEVEILRKEVEESRALHQQAVQDLKAEKESLASAKLIISSLEQANQDMRRDMRSRLQDSNTVIASLLSKSMEREKSSDGLRSELDRLRKENEEIKERYTQQDGLLMDSSEHEDGFDEQAQLQLTSGNESYAKTEEITETID